MSIEAPVEGISTCRSNGPNGELIERPYDYVIASRSLQGKIKKMDVVEEIESRPHKAIAFLVGRDKEIREGRELKMPETSPGYRGGKMPGRSGRRRKRRE